MGVYNLALILKNPVNEAQFLLVKQTPPPEFTDEEYVSFVDSDLWDLPSTKLDVLEGNPEPGVVIEGVDSLMGEFDYKKYNFDLAINRVQEQLGIMAADCEGWTFFKFVKEPDFGPGLPIHTICINRKLATCSENLSVFSYNFCST